MAVLYQIAAAAGVLPALRALQAGRRARQAQPIARALLGAILAQVAPEGALDGPAPWHLQRFAPTAGDITVMMVGPRGRAPAAVVKLARTPSAVESLRRCRAASDALRRDERLPPEWRGLVPAVLGAGEAAGSAFLVETPLPGRTLAGALGQGLAREAQRSAAAAIGQLHHATAAALPVDAGVRERLLDGHIAALRAAIAASPRAAQLAPALARLYGELRGALEAGPLAVGWVHGDLAPNNVLVSADGVRITGLIDWELSSSADLPALDLAQLLLSSRLTLGQGELGLIVEDVLHGAGWRDDEAELLERSAAGLPGRPVGPRALTLLCWLRHVSDTLRKAPRYARNRFWVAANVEHVLARL